MSPQAPPQCFTQNVACSCFEHAPCACGREERILRHVSEGKHYPAFTPEEREWCTQQIASVEGYSEQDATGTDAQVARTVLSAWTDYCRDKGLM